MPKAKPQASKPMKLQANTAGAWKDVITFDGAQDHVTTEVMNNIHYVGIHASERVLFRIIGVESHIGVLAHWSHKDGWKVEDAER